MNGMVKTSAKLSPANLKVTLHDALTGQSTEMITDGSGAFSVAEAEQGDHFFYVSVAPTDEIILTVILGATIPETFVINEVTTVAACYSAAQFITAGIVIEGSPFALSIVEAMNANLVDVTTGMPSSVMTSSPNGDETNACRSLLSLANVVAAWVNDPAEFHAILAKLAANANGTKPDDTIEALVSIAKNPAKGVGAIYAQSKVLPVYTPALERQPDAWTLVVKVNNSGDDANMFGGPGNVAFDSQGRAWIANNVQQGTGMSTAYSIVLDKSGRPVTFANGNGSPITGGGLCGPGFGVAVDSQDRAWFGDFGWGGDKYWPTGSVSAFDANANPLSPAPDGYTTGGVRRVQGTVVDDDNVWFASYGTGNGDGNVVVYIKPDPNVTPFTYASYAAGPTATPFDIAIAADGSAWMTNSNPESSGIVHLQYNGTETLTASPQIDIGQTTKGIQIDSAGNIWVASGGDDHVYVFDKDGNFLGGFQGGGIDGPWGCILDGDDNLWVANFGPLEPGSNFHGRLTQLAGINATNHRLGDGLTPQTGYTLPSAGSPVLLHDNTPLYGGDTKSFIPMMRTTGVNIDAAGNVWTCNNWKPNFDNDAIGGAAGNPGGDGMLIWVGLAKPRS